MLPPTERGEPRGASCTSVDRRSVFPPRLVGLYLYSIDHRAASSKRKIVGGSAAPFRGRHQGLMNPGLDTEKMRVFRNCQREIGYHFSALCDPGGNKSRAFVAGHAASENLRLSVSGPRGV